MKEHLPLIGRIIIGCSILIGAWKLAPTESLKTNDSMISVFSDITEKEKDTLYAENILSQLNIRENKYDGVTFRFLRISDIELNPIAQIELKSTSILLSNEISRDKEIKKFEDSVMVLFENSLSDSSGRKYSSIYLPIAKELTLLSKSDSKSKMLIVHSDLMENTPSLSFYKFYKNYSYDNKELISRISKLYELPNLTGINVYLIYQPDSVQADIYYKEVSRLYESLLVEKGAKVFIQANFLKTDM